MEQACGAPSNKALHSVLRISPGTPGDVPASNGNQAKPKTWQAERYKDSMTACRVQFRLSCHRQDTQVT